MTSTLAHAAADVIDLRQIPPRERHALVFGRFDALQPGQSLQLLNDHDPQPLRYQFEDRSYGRFDWRVLDAGPALWRVLITRTAPGKAGAAAQDSCCSGGACCG